MSVSSTFKTSAPGKAVLWGEYAVLAGAPAAVMAVNRRAQCSITAEGEYVSFSSKGFEAPPARVDSLLTPNPPPIAQLAYHAAKQLAGCPSTGLSIRTDTSAFYMENQKIGIGSSAATMVCIFAALAKLTDSEITLPALISAHRSFQGSGSGLDVAAALNGGAIRFQRGDATKWTLPDTLKLRFFFSGSSTETHDKLQSFSSWHGQEKDELLGTLTDKSEALFRAPDDLVLWKQYIEALRKFDSAGSLGIFGSAHLALQQTAQKLSLAYKPCGAGGGDIGVLVYHNATPHEDVLSFIHNAKKLNFSLLDLEQDTQGLEIQ